MVEKILLSRSNNHNAPRSSVSHDVTAVLQDGFMGSSSFRSLVYTDSRLGGGRSFSQVQIEDWRQTRDDTAVVPMFLASRPHKFHCQMIDHHSVTTVPDDGVTVRRSSLSWKSVTHCTNAKILNLGGDSEKTRNIRDQNLEWRGKSEKTLKTWIVLFRVGS